MRLGRRNKKVFYNEIFATNCGYSIVVRNFKFIEEISDFLGNYVAVNDFFGDYTLRRSACIADIFDMNLPTLLFKLYNFYLFGTNVYTDD